MKHKHHIIPKHMGGTDDASNIVELTIEEHADAHRKLWLEHGKIEDKIAWKCLSGRKLTEEDRLSLSKSGYEKFLQDEKRVKNWKKSISEKRKEQIITPEHRKNISLGLLKCYKENRFTYTKPSMDFLRENYEKNKEKMEEGRRNSSRWKESVTSEEYREKKRVSDPRSRKVSVNGVIYDSIRHAAKKTQISYSKLRNLLLSNADDNIFFC